MEENLNAFNIVVSQLVSVEIKISDEVYQFTVFFTKLVGYSSCGHR